MIMTYHSQNVFRYSKRKHGSLALVVYHIGHAVETELQFHALKKYIFYNHFFIMFLSFNYVIDCQFPNLVVPRLKWYPSG